MKKLLVCVAALGMLFTSCMRDETRLDEGSVVSFKISAPAVSTRAAIEDTYGTGVAAEELHWAIFEADENGDAVGDVIFEDVVEDFFAADKMENTFNVRLVKGKSYVGMFWAQAPDAPYTVAWPEVTIGDVKSNDENLDAFFNIHNFSITAGQDTGEQQVELRRPFAQLNVAIPATDLEAAKAAGFELAKTGVSLEAAKSLNLVTGLVGAAEEVTYALTDIPTGVTATLDGTEYQLISFNYILVDGDAWAAETDEGQELKTITFNYGTADETLSQTFSSIAVERNHRTYIVGSLLSETVDFRVIILPDWEDPYYLNNMEAGSIEMVAEQTTINKAAMGSATLTWNAVEGATYYGVEYKGEELGKVNPDGTTRADDATATVTWNTPEGKVTDATASFTIKAYNENDKVIARVVTEPIAVFSLANRPEPAVYVADGKLIVENKELKGSETTKSNLDINGVLLEAEIYFYKDGATTPTHTAKGTFTDTNGKTFENLRVGIEEDNPHKIKNNIASSYNAWKWDGATTATTALPAFEKGTYTIKYKAGYYPVINATYNADGQRINFPEASDVLQKMQYREGEVKDFKLVIAEATTPEAVAEGYQGAKVTWPAVDGAASYQVFAGATKVADATTNEATVTGLTDANKYKFIVKSLDANGNVIATSVESNEIQVWTLTGMPTPAVSFDGATLSVSDILDVYGVGYDVTITFTNGSLTHTATYNKAFDQDGVKSRFSGNGFMAHANTDDPDLGRFTKGSFDPCTTWYWDKTPAAADYETKQEDAAPAFEVGEWTISYSVSYAPLINAYWSVKNSTDVMAEADANRINLKNKGADVLFDPANPIKLEGTLAEKYVVGMNPKVEIAGLYQAAKITWSPVAGASSYTVAYGTTEACTDGSVNATETTATIENLNAARNYYFKITGGSESATVSADIFTLYDYNPSFEIVKQDNGSWKLNMYRLSYKAGAFHRIAFKIKEQGSDAVIYEEQGVADDVGHIALDPHVKGWTSHYYIPWINQTDANWSTEAGKKLAGITFKAGTTYVVEYTAYLIPGVPAKSKEDYVAGCQAAGLEAYPNSYKQEDIDAGTIFFFSAMNRDFDNIPSITGTMEFTTAQ